MPQAWGILVPGTRDQTSFPGVEARLLITGTRELPKCRDLRWTHRYPYSWEIHNYTIFKMWNWQSRRNSFLYFTDSVGIFSPCCTLWIEVLCLCSINYLRKHIHCKVENFKNFFRKPGYIINSISNGGKGSKFLQEKFFSCPLEIQQMNDCQRKHRL